MTECDTDRYADLTGTKKFQPFVTTQLEVTSLQLMSYNVLQTDMLQHSEGGLLKWDKVIKVQRIL